MQPELRLEVLATIIMGKALASSFTVHVQHGAYIGKSKKKAVLASFPSHLDRSWASWFARASGELRTIGSANAKKPRHCQKPLLAELLSVVQPKASLDSLPTIVAGELCPRGVMVPLEQVDNVGKSKI
ncbi:hypothetical protein HDU86_003723 [Geranomyces michiganensis]|nr:hypothetical protein HDU86_003723 [Geranomyces michiganensis]